MNTPRVSGIKKAIFIVLILAVGRPAAPQTAYTPYYGDIHSHTAFSDGLEGSTPANAYAHARDVAGLDFFAVTDHFPADDPDAGWGMQASEYLQAIAEADAANADGVFVALYGYEWTMSDADYHGNVLMAPAFGMALTIAGFYETLFYDRMADGRIVGQFNHPALGASADWGDWAFSSMGGWAMRRMEVRGDYPPALSRVGLTGEIAQYAAAIENGWLVGADGSKDTHGGTWGEFGENYWEKFTTVALASSLTRDDILEALSMRRTYVSQDSDFRTSPLTVEFTASTDGGATFPFTMGQAVQPSGTGATVRLSAADGGADYLEEARIYKNGSSVARQTGIHALTATLLFPDPNPAHGDFYFGVIIQEDGEIALTSPLFLRVGDFDADGLLDADEINLFDTNPNYPDTDGDGLSDGEEVSTLLTEPLNPDTDGDGYMDLVEAVCGGAGIPRDPARHPGTVCINFAPIDAPRPSGFAPANAGPYDSARGYGW